jgi:hypothetical protein
LTGPMDKICGGLDGAGGTDDEHKRGLIDLLLDTIHFERNYAEEDDVRAKAGAAGATRNFVEGVVDGVVFGGWAAASGFAAGFGEFTMHVDEAGGTGALVEVVDVLGAEEETVA